MKVVVPQMGPDDDDDDDDGGDDDDDDYDDDDDDDDDDPLSVDIWMSDDITSSIQRSNGRDENRSR